MTAQSNGSPRNVTVLECSLVQDVHPLVKLLLEEVDETDEMVALDSMEMEPEYGGEDKVMEPEDDMIKYCPGMEVVIPSYTFRGYNAHSSKVWPDRIIYGQNRPSVAHTLLLGTEVTSAEHNSVTAVHT